MLTQQKIALLVLRGQVYHQELVRGLSDKERQGDEQGHEWDKPILIWQAIAALNMALLYADYNSADTLQVYDNLAMCIGANALGPISTDPNAQVPGGNIIVINNGGSTVQSAIIPFVTDIVTLANYQTAYKPTFGNGAVISIWTLNGNGIGYSEDTGTVPSKTFVDNDPTKDLLTVTWTYPLVTTGYIQILGVITS